MVLNRNRVAVPRFYDELWMDWAGDYLLLLYLLYTTLGWINLARWKCMNILRNCTIFYSAQQVLSSQCDITVLQYLYLLCDIAVFCIIGSVFTVWQLKWRNCRAQVSSFRPPSTVSHRRIYSFQLPPMKIFMTWVLFNFNSDGNIVVFLCNMYL